MKNRYLRILLSTALISALVITALINISGCRGKNVDSTEMSDNSENTSDKVISRYGEDIPVDETVNKNEYDPALFSRSEDGRITYGSDTAKSGIDISAYQGEIDWDQVAGAGIDFAIIRVGFRGYESGSLNHDDSYEANITGALSAGLDVGVYFFSQAISPEEAAAEADFVLDSIADYDIKYPIVFDWEYITDEGANARTNGISSSVITDCALSFCETVKNAGYTPAIYFNTDLGYTEYEIGRIADHTLWLAEYADYPTFYYDFHIWQYTSAGSVPGIEGTVDLNISFDDYGNKK